MLYFAYGSNLNWHQMKKERCPGSKFLKSHNLKGYKLCFSHKTNHSIYGHANIIKSKKSTVLGALWKITKKNEKVLDLYEGVNYNYYQKEYFSYKGQKALVYVQKIYYLKKPNSAYLHTIINGYKNCDIDLSKLRKTLSKYKIDYEVKW